MRLPIALQLYSVRDTLAQDFYGTLKQVKEGDRKPTAPKGASGKPGQAELDAIAKLLKEG